MLRARKNETGATTIEFAFGGVSLLILVVSLDLSPFLAQKVKTQNSSNGEFESWGYHAGSSRKSLRLPRCGS